MADQNRLAQLRALVARLERLPASPRREWMLEEARARMVDVETGFPAETMRPLDTGRHAPTAKPRRRERSDPGAMKPRAPARAVAPHADDTPVADPSPAPFVLEVSRDPTGAGVEALLDTDELLSLEDSQTNDSPPLLLWRRGLRG